MSSLFAPLLDFFRGLSPREIATAVLDVGIVYYAIYRVLLLIKGTRAQQMLIGLVLIGAAFFAARELELVTLSWLLDNFINYFIIIIIVVFQSDIRRGLMRIGSNLFAFSSPREQGEALDGLVAAVEQLARRHTGALIVLERDAEVSQFTEEGVSLDARLTRELLLSIFQAHGHNPLHDGAVIVRGWRVAQAGAVLPLTERLGLGKEMGTRHRSALGITEQTDAAVVVVSEERGEISLAFRGNIARGLDGESLRKALHGLFAKDRRKEAARRAQAQVRAGTPRETDPAMRAAVAADAAAAVAGDDLPPSLRAPAGTAVGGVAVEAAASAAGAAPAPGAQQS